MTELHKCLESLRRLIAEAHVNGIPLAEKAIEDFLAAIEPTAHKKELRNVQQGLQARLDGSSGAHLSFADAVNDYIEKKMRPFE